MNPCPCGYLGSPLRACRCSPDQVARYQGRLSGPLLDRIDLHMAVCPLPTGDLLQAPAGESTQQVRERCLAGAEMDVHTLLEDAALKFLDAAATRLGWSARGTHRTLKVARTIADLAGASRTGLEHVAEALQYRQALQAHP